jgi:hypothetical protein
LGAYGVITRGQNSADDDGIGGVGNSSSGISKRPVRVHKLPAKFKDAPIGNSSVRASKIRRNMAITDDEDIAQPQKKKPKTRLLVDTEPDTDTDQVSLNDTCAHTDVSSNWDDLGKASIKEANTSDAMGCGSDEEDWEFSQLDMMATKDAQVRNMCEP